MIEIAVLLLALVGTPPTMTNHAPSSGGIVAPQKLIVAATFDQPMNPVTINQSTFNVIWQGGVISGQVFYDSDSLTAVFLPDATLPNNQTFIVELGGAQSVEGFALAKPSWRFHTATPAPDLGASCNYAILAKSGISSVPASNIVGNIGVSPIAATAITGFALSLHSSGQHASSSQVQGRVHAADYAEPTPSNLTIAVLDMEAAYTEAATRPADFTEVGAGDISGMVLSPGVYKWGTGLLISTEVTLAGDANDVWIFQVAQTLALEPSANVILQGGAQAENVFWQVAGDVVLGPDAHLEGIILCATNIALQTGASVNGKLLAQTAVTLDMATVIWPPVEVLVSQPQ